MLYIWPYKMGSMGARALAKSFPVLRVYPNRRFRLKRRKYVLNWGNSGYPDWLANPFFDTNVYNHPEQVALAVNKIKTYTTIPDLVPPYTFEQEQARRWLNEGNTVYARTIVTGSGGRGIVVCRGTDDCPRAPLYTLGQKVDREYRVHVFHDTVIDVTQKRRIGRGRREADGITINPDVRNHAGGWIFARESLEIRPETTDMAVAAVNTLGLDFGAVDIAECGDHAVVFEVNTAPGIDGTTVSKYNTFLKEFFNV